MNRSELILTSVSSERICFFPPRIRISPDLISLIITAVQPCQKPSLSLYPCFFPRNVLRNDLFRDKILIQRNLVRNALPAAGGIPCHTEIFFSVISHRQAGSTASGLIHKACLAAQYLTVCIPILRRNQLEITSPSGCCFVTEVMYVRADNISLQNASSAAAFIITAMSYAVV